MSATTVRRAGIRLSLEGAREVERDLQRLGETGERSLGQVVQSAAAAGRGLDLLNIAIRGTQILALAAGMREVVQAGDALTQSLFRLQTATGSVQAAADVYQQLYQVSLRTGVAVTESADAFQRFSVAARAIGATNAEVARLVGGIQAAAIVSGASAQEIGSATLQRQAT